MFAYILACLFASLILCHPACFLVLALYLVYYGFYLTSTRPVCLNYMLSVPRIYTYGIHSSYVSFYIAASLFNGFLLIYSALWLNAVSVPSVATSYASMPLLSSSATSSLAATTTSYAFSSLLSVLVSPVSSLLATLSGSIPIYVLVLVSLAYMFVVVSYWVNDLLIESFLYFNLNELSVLYLGFKLFILSEFMIFLSLFGSFLNHTLLSLTFSSLFVIYFAIPFSNLLILLYSSFSIQSSLIFMKFGFLFNTVEGLSQTIGIGILFVVLQFKEFLYSIYTYSSSFLGSILYFTTGLHGLHVLIGLLLLLFSFYSFLMYAASYNLIFK